MLYKKIHRQHVRQFRVGRKFRFVDNYNDRVYKITGKPHIPLFTKGKRSTIRVDCWDLIFVWSGKLWHKDDITWLN